MKKTVTLFMVVLYVLSSTQLREMAKLPVLFQHYFEHKSIDQQLSFLTYVVDHYNSVPHADDDEERDNQLPFKTLDHGLSATLSFALPTSGYYTLKRPTQLVSISHLSNYQENFIPNTHSGKVWQPPKA